MHMAPGFVSTPLSKSLARSNWAGPVLALIYDGLASVFSVSPLDCGEYMWHGVYAAKSAVAGRFDRHGEDIGDKKLFTVPEAKEKVWMHTLEETSK